MISAKKGVNLDHVKYTGVELKSSIIDFYVFRVNVCCTMKTPNKGLWNQTLNRKMTNKGLLKKSQIGSESYEKYKKWTRIAIIATQGY